ncbi:hypothetical protein RJ639_040703 [Escallonia herrerae]|uniref:BHLH domain-containing protein n=1 Tax=Escallonia herrerae TaxID=1293975 RepID=A0AA88WF54_9ASTE|nr:hypothetical protein RJ639_040703 [Escallonia herrerae]
MNSSMELLNNMSALENYNSNSNSNIHGLMPLSNNSFYSDHRPHIPTPFTDNIQSSFPPNDQFYDPLSHFLPPADQGPSYEHGKGISEGESLVNSSTPIFGTGMSYGGKKRKRNNEREGEKPREVVHVRARRGQATDSHSLAERLRREKINEKLRSLQDLVPGCYKTMGMAVMLDVIVNYVRSLQNQIEFLSMKLSAASLFYDFNSSEMDALETMQGTAGYETQGMERMEGEGYGGFPQFQSAWPI